MDSPEELPTVLSLCTGYGGIERGLELAGFEHRVVAHVEIEAFAIANLVAKMEAGQLDAAPIWSNLKTLPVDCFRDKVYLLTGGYPCQPFSAAGKRKGKDDPRHLWPYINDIIRAIRPVQCFFENVEGHISLGLGEVIEDLEKLGYKTTWGIFSAEEVGAPHQRKRIFILANPKGIGVQGLRTSGEQKPHAHGKEKLSVCEDERPRPTESDAFANLGRGFDGPPSWLDGSWELGIPRVTSDQKNRVDRLRLLGNGVCPPTAARAWTLLNEQIKEEK